MQSAVNSDNKHRLPSVFVLWLHFQPQQFCVIYFITNILKLIHWCIGRKTVNSMDSNISLLYWDCGKITRTNLFKKLFLSNCFAIFTNAWFRIAGHETHYSISISKIETLCNLELFSDVISFLLIPSTTHIMRPRRKKVNLNTPYECTCTWSSRSYMYVHGFKL